MSRLLITGPGHSGGNWVNEICRETGMYNFTKVIEDRNIMYHKELPEGYATKITTDFPGINWMYFFSLMDNYDDLKIIFTFRHPLDNCLSKIVRGMPMEGNEPFSNLIEFSYEATLYGSVKSIEYALLTIHTLNATSSPKITSRIRFVRLEDLIRDEERQVKSICNFIGIEYNDELLGGYARTNNKWQVKRYNRELDSSQIDMYKRWDTIYDGFYKDKKEHVEMMAYLLIPCINGLGYSYERI